MNQILTIASFEFLSRLRLVSTWIYFLLFAAMAAVFIAATGGAFQGASVLTDSSKVLINSPYAIAQAITFVGFIGVVVVAALMGRVVQQDFECQISALFFTSPITKHSYFFGRYAGGFLAMGVVYLGIAVGIVIGTHWPGVDPARVGPFTLQHFLQPYVVNIVPNLLFLGAVFFGLAAVTRRMLPVYVAGVVVFVGFLVARQLMGDLENQTVAALADPIGVTAQALATRYWSVAEKNVAFVPLSGVLLWNRLLWLGAGFAVLALCYRRFSMGHGSESHTASARKTVDEAPSIPTAVWVLPQVSLDTTALAWLRQLPQVTLLQLRETIKNIYFGVIVLAGVLFTIVNSTDLGSLFGTKTWPVTFQLLDVTSGNFFLLVLIITAIYAGELVWRERDARLDEIADSFPAPAWLGFTAKLLTLFAVQALLMGVVLLTTMLLQASQGYFKFELGHSLYELFALQLPTYWIMAGMALATHIILNQKYAAHALVIMFFALRPQLGSFGLDHNLYLPAGTPSITYSDMNGYDHFVPAVRWFQAYWAGFTALLLLAAYLLWVRGRETGWGARVRIARGRASPAWALSAGATAALTLCLGGWVFYNTNVLNPYLSSFDGQQRQAEYEKQFGSLDGAAQPRITAIKIAADIFPREHRLRVQGTYTLRNKTSEPIKSLYVNLATGGTLNGARASHGVVNELAPDAPWHDGASSNELGWREFVLETPLAPAASLGFRFDLEYSVKGFTNSGADRVVVDNGTSFINDLLPYFGYLSARELGNDKDRKKFGLPPKINGRDLDDAAGRMISGTTTDWVEYEAVVSTDEDQIAVTPGYLQREWIANGRRYFEYKMDAPMMHSYGFNSARYQVRRDRWEGQGGVPIEVYYHPGHEYNLDRMIASVKESLDYASKNFSPYQHRQVRILEFPRYALYAQALPNTIPYSESFGFIARVDPTNPKDIDYPFYVTAHEMGHQWWGHQVSGASVQGASMISETLAQYTALMVMKQAFGNAKMKRFLAYELDRYLLDRGLEQNQELPLFRTAGQGYVHYQKGSLAMYALQDAIGEDAVNRALAEFLRKYAFKDPPYPTTRELLAEFRAVAPPDKQALITDLFEKITLYENRVTQASYRKQADGRYVVSLVVSAKKFYADGAGAETETPMNDWIDIGVLDAQDTPIFMEKRRISAGETKLEVVVDQAPYKAGIDPMNMMIDRQPTDNVMLVNAE